MDTQIIELLESLYPYAKDCGIIRTLPPQGRSKDEILAEIKEISGEEDKFWENGLCSGTMYCGDHEHYAFLNKIFACFSHVNALQRDMCPSMTRFESEIIAMSLELMHGEEVMKQNSMHYQYLTILLVYFHQYKIVRNLHNCFHNLRKKQTCRMKCHQELLHLH